MADSAAGAKTPRADREIAPVPSSPVVRNGVCLNFATGQKAGSNDRAVRAVLRSACLELRRTRTAPAKSLGWRCPLVAIYTSLHPLFPSKIRKWSRVFPLGTPQAGSPGRLRVAPAGRGRRTPGGDRTGTVVGEARMRVPVCLFSSRRGRAGVWTAWCLLCKRRIWSWRDRRNP